MRRKEREMNKEFGIVIDKTKYGVLFHDFR